MNGKAISTPLSLPHHALVPKRRNLRFDVAEFAQGFVRVLAEGGRGTADGSGRVGQLDGDAYAADAAGDGVVGLDSHPARLDLGVGVHGFDVVYGAGGDSGGVQGG